MSTTPLGRGATSTAEYLAIRAAAMTEAQLQALILDAARVNGWLAYHTHDSRRSQPGFPDLVLVRGRRTIYRELKTQKGRLRPDQTKWLNALDLAGNDTGVWRPADWFNDVIVRELAA